MTVENEQKPLCTDDYSDLSPLTGGNVAFSTLENRPSAFNFDSSLVLQVRILLYQWLKQTSFLSFVHGGWPSSWFCNTLLDELMVKTIFGRDQILQPLKYVTKLFF